MDVPRNSPRLERLLALVREQFDSEFDFVTPGPLPWTPRPQALTDLQVALVTTGGLHLKRDAPFLGEEERFGDTSFRWVPHGTRPRELDLGAPYVDKKYAAGDPEVALPMRALERLHREGHTGRPARRHASFCSGIVRPLPGLARSAAELETVMREDGTGAVVLLPTCSLCVQSVCLLAREMEAAGFRTVTITMLPELTELVGAPRALSVRFPFGAPCGDPMNRNLHRAILLESMALIQECEEPGKIHKSRFAWRREA